MPRRSHRLRFSAKVMLYLLTAYVILAVLFGSMYYINARQTTENRVIAEISLQLQHRFPLHRWERSFRVRQRQSAQSRP